MQVCTLYTHRTSIINIVTIATEPLVQDFLNAAWGDLIQEIVADKELDLEISKAYSSSSSSSSSSVNDNNS